MKALIVDDQVSVHQFLAKAINWSFYGITELIYAFNGEEALNLINLECPELMILDIKMPLMSGLELLQKLDTRKLQPKIIILSAYHEFEYAQEAMKYGVKNYILKPIDPQKLESAITNLIEERQTEIKLLAERCLTEIVHEMQNPDQTLIDTMQTVFATLNIERYLVAIISCRQSISDQASNSSLQDLKRTEYPSLLTVATVRSKFFLLIPMVSLQPEVAHCQLFIKLIHSWNQQYPEIGFIIGFSKSSANVTDIYELFRQASTAIQMSFYNQGSVFYSSSTLFQYENNSASLEKLKANILDSIQMNFPKAKLLAQIQQFFNYFCADRIFPNLVYQSCYDLLLVIKSNYIKLNGKNPLNDDFALETYHKCETLEELEAAFTQTVLNLNSSLQSDSAKLENIIQEIKLYAESCYGEDLSLDTVANKFFISKYRLSRLFKKATGENYWDFVTRIRMEKAQFLLTNTNLKSYEVALKVGYDDICHFSTLFKKYFGKSPKQFRKVVNGNYD